jgi:hypothetical protein
MIPQPEGIKSGCEVNSGFTCNANAEKKEEIGKVARSRKGEAVPLFLQHRKSEL